MLPVRDRSSPEMVFKAVDLPAPLRADERDDLALVHFKRDVLDGVDLAIVYIDVFNSQHGTWLILLLLPR